MKTPLVIAFFVILCSTLPTPAQAYSFAVLKKQIADYCQSSCAQSSSTQSSSCAHSSELPEQDLLELSSAQTLRHFAVHAQGEERQKILALILEREKTEREYKIKKRQRAIYLNVMLLSATLLLVAATKSLIELELAARKIAAADLLRDDIVDSATSVFDRWRDAYHAFMKKIMGAE